MRTPALGEALPEDEFDEEMERAVRAYMVRMRMQRVRAALAPGGPGTRTAAGGPTGAATGRSVDTARQPGMDVMEQHAAATETAAVAAKRRDGNGHQPLVAIDTRSLPTAFKTLQHAEASSSAVAREWLFALRNVFRSRQIAESDDANRLHVAAYCWDSDMDDWWQGVVQELAAEGQRPTWIALVDALQRDFRPVADAELAYDELLGAKQGSESMEQYLRRMQKVLSRAGAEAGNDRAVVRSVLNGVHEQRMPFGCARVKEAYSDRQVRGERETFAWLRQELSRAALREPKLQFVQHSGTPSGAKRVAPITKQREQQKGSDDGDTGVAQDTDGARKCYKCGKEDHIASECQDATERRSCYKCGTAGHLRKDCPKSKKE